MAVYAGKDNQTIVKADRSKELLRNSILMPYLAASIMNAKYVNGLPLYRINQEFLRNDIHISRQVMANWRRTSGKQQELHVSLPDGKGIWGYSYYPV